MIYIVEAFVEDYLHVLANVNLIEIFRKVYDKDSMVFIAPEKHTDKVKKYFNDGDTSLSFKPINNLKVAADNLISRCCLILARLFRDVITFYKLFRLSKATDIVVITHIYYPSLVLIKVLKKYFFPNVITFVVIHGDVEYVYYPLNQQHKIIGFLYKLAFKIKAKNFKYIFLTPISKDILIQTNRTSADETIAIELPTFPNRINYEEKNNSNHLKLRIAHIGSAGIRKNVHLFYQLADKLKLELFNNYLEFSNIGVLEMDIQPYLNPLIKNYVNDIIGKPLERKDYDSKISDLDYAIFFYGKNDFILRSSAAFFDAIYYEKPFIALKNTFFDDLFSREGILGYLCENLEEMANVITNLAHDRENAEIKRLKMMQNIRIYKSKLTIESISSALKKDIHNDH